MENTKENRINYLRSQFSLLGKRGDLESAGNKLNEALIKKRQVRVISKWSEFLSELSSEFSSELRSEGLWSEFWSELWSDLWFSVVQRKMTFKEVMGLINIEQRMATLKVYGAEKLLEDSNAILISKSGKGNELFLIDGVFSQPAYFLKYACPSTERVYVSGVDPEIGKTHDPDECMAWKYSITKEEYLGLMES